MSEIDFSKIESVHFIGIGGIGTSAIARMFLLEGKKVSGSDIADSEILGELQRLGADISIGQFPKGLAFGTKAKPLGNAELVIYSAAIQVADPKLFKQIKALNIPSLSYAEALGEISRGKKTIAISGTHGKTTTTAMIAKILIDAGLSPTVIVGSLISAPTTPPRNEAPLLVQEGRRTNYIHGSSDLFLVEADEYQRSFLELSPKVLVVTNIDADHLDYYRNLADVQSAFVELANKVPKDGAIVTDFDNPNVEPLAKSTRATMLDYNSANTDGLKLKFPGEHNRQNARAALIVAGFFGVPREKAIASLNSFEGAWRRFEYKGETASGALVYDDYAHNPQKVRAVLAGARELFPNKKIIAVFQPHLYSRTKTLFTEFSRSFADADEVILVPIFPAREKFDQTISSEMLLKKITETSPDKMLRYIVTFDETADYLKKIADKNTVALTIGAGDVYKIAEQIIQK